MTKAVLPPGSETRFVSNTLVVLTMQERDFDEFARHIRAAAPSDPLIFNCQLGGGRTTTGTVIGCLVRSFAAEAGRKDDGGGGGDAAPAAGVAPAAASGKAAKPGAAQVCSEDVNVW